MGAAGGTASDKASAGAAAAWPRARGPSRQRSGNRPRDRFAVSRRVDRRRLYDRGDGWLGGDRAAASRRSSGPRRHLRAGGSAVRKLEADEIDSDLPPRGGSGETSGQGQERRRNRFAQGLRPPEAREARETPERRSPPRAGASRREKPFDLPEPGCRGDGLDERAGAPRARELDRHEGLDRPARGEARRSEEHTSELQ